jgi:drug/metabolite transporter (DMT)-like permease
MSHIEQHDQPLKGFLFALIATVLVSTNFVTAKYGLQGFNSHAFSVIWTISATIYAFIIVLATGLRKGLAIPKSSILPIIILGITTAGAMLLGWAGLALLDPSFASFIWRFFPALTIVLSAIFLRERFSPIEIIPISIMIIGGAISGIGRWSVVGTGIILTICACLAAAVQMLIAKVKVKQIHPNVLVFYRVGIAAVLIALWTFSIGKAEFHTAPRYWLVTMLGAFLGPCASFLFMFRSYQYWGLSRSSIVLISQPLFVLPMAFVFLQRLPTSRGLIGGFLILAGAFWLAWLHFRRKRE